LFLRLNLCRLEIDAAEAIVLVSRAAAIPASRLNAGGRERPGFRNPEVNIAPHHNAALSSPDGFRRNAVMPEANHSANEVAKNAAHNDRTSARSDQPMDDEEKVLAGKPDANMPALLTKDVLGG
jgi:hypothetical protein